MGVEHLQYLHLLYSLLQWFSLGDRLEFHVKAYTLYSYTLFYTVNSEY